MRARVETEKDATPRAADDAAARRPPPTTALRVGAACRARASFDEEMRAGEIVDAREEAGGSGRVTAYYVHYRDLNKRLDEWVRAEASHQGLQRLGERMRAAAHAERRGRFDEWLGAEVRVQRPQQLNKRNVDCCGRICRA